MSEGKGKETAPPVPQGRLPNRGRGNAAFRWRFARSVPMGRADLPTGRPESTRPMQGVYGGLEASRHGGGPHSPSFRGAPTHFDDQDFPVFLGRAPALHIPKGAPASPLGLVYHPSEWARGFPPRPLMRGQSDCPETVVGPGAHGAAGCPPPGKRQEAKRPLSVQARRPSSCPIHQCREGRLRIDVGFGVSRSGNPR